MRLGNIRQETSWTNYRRALGKEDRDMFDEMVGIAQIHAPALESSTIDRLEGLILAILFEQEKEICRLRGKSRLP